MRLWLLVLFFGLSALGAAAYAMDLLPDLQVQRLQDARQKLVRFLPGDSAMPEPELALESGATWVRGDYAFSRLRVRNAGDRTVLASAGRVQCTALDARRSEIGRWRSGDLGSVKPGQEVSVGIGIPLSKGRLESLDCRLAH